MFVDFDYIPFEHMTMIHVPFEDAMPLLDTLYRAKALDSMEVRIKPPFTTCLVKDNGIAKLPTSLCLMFSNMSHVEVERRAAELKGLWGVLHNYSVKVVWKHGLQGHEVGPNYEILDSWQLDDGMC